MEEGTKLAKKNWFTLKVRSGSEASIIHQIELNFKAAGIEDCLEEIYSPSVQIKSGNKTREKKLYPGYIFIKMVMSEKTKDAVLSIPQVYSFLSSGKDKAGVGIPAPVSEREYENMIAKVNKISEANVQGETFVIGDVVRIKSGSFNEFKGTVIAVDNEKKLLKLSILVFQRETHVTVAFDDAEKIN